MDTNNQSDQSLCVNLASSCKDSKTANRKNLAIFWLATLGVCGEGIPILLPNLNMLDFGTNLCLDS